MELQRAINLVFGGDPDAAVPDLEVNQAVHDWTQDDVDSLDREVGLIAETELRLWLRDELPDEDFEAPLFKRLVSQWD